MPGTRARRSTSSRPDRLPFGRWPDGDQHAVEPVRQSLRHEPQSRRLYRAQGYEGWRYPHVLGVDVAGVIETIGEGVVSWDRGDQVFYHTTWPKNGSYAEFNVAAQTFARIPEGISFVEAATFPCAAEGLG